MCCVLGREGFGVDSGLLQGFLSGRVKLGLKSGYLVQKSEAGCAPGARRVDNPPNGNMNAVIE